MTDLSKTAIVAHDAGAANIIFAWFAPVAPPLRAYVEGPARDAWRRRFGDAVIAPTLEDAIDGVEFLLTGSGWSSDLEHEARAIAAKSGLRSIALIDHWTNYAARFERDGTTVLPDEIWVTDDYALEIAQRTFPGIAIRQQSNTYFDAQVAAAGSVAADGTLLWIGEPARSHWGRDKPGEFQALDYFVAHRERLAIGDDVPAVLRPHPAEPAGKYDDWIARHRGWSCGAEGELSEALRGVRWVVGLESAALAIALAGGRTVVSALPEWAPPCRLPHADIVHLKDLVAK